MISYLFFVCLFVCLLFVYWKIHVSAMFSNTQYSQWILKKNITLIDFFTPCVTYKNIYLFLITVDHMNLWYFYILKSAKITQTKIINTLVHYNKIDKVILTSCFSFHWLLLFLCLCEKYTAFIVFHNGKIYIGICVKNQDGVLIINRKHALPSINKLQVYTERWELPCNPLYLPFTKHFNK